MKYYLKSLKKSIIQLENDSSFVDQFVKNLIETKDTNTLFIIGNGGSAANAIHIANDFIYGAIMDTKIHSGFNVDALASNQAVITCLANDIGFDQIFSHQLKSKAKKKDILLALSGSGNSQNIINAVNYANQINMKTYSITGYNGGVLKTISQNTLHFEIEDMQVSEDMQLIFGHYCMKKINNILKK